MKRLSLTFLLSHLLLFATYAESPDSSKTVYFEDYSDLLTLRMFTLTKISAIVITDDKESKTVTYEPNESTSLGFGFNYRWIGLNFAFIPLGKNDDDIYGNTESFDLQANIFSRKFGGEFHLLNYTGFYWDNVSDFIPNFQPEINGYPVRSDVQSRALGGHIFYNFNHDKFSLRAAFLQNERQVKSAGSWIVGGYVNFVDIRSLADSAYLLPSSVANQFNEALQVKKISTFNIGALGGYAHTFVLWKRVFLTGAVAIGLGGESVTREYDLREDQKGGSVNVTAIFRGAIGYNSKHFYLGFNASTNSTNVGAGESTNINYSSGNLRFVLAYRLRSKVLDKFSDSIGL